MSRKIQFLGIIVLLGSMAFSAQTLNLQQVLEIASRQNLDILQAQEGQKSAYGRIKEAYSYAMPNVSMEGSMQHVSNSIAVGDNTQTSLSLTLNQALYRGGSVGAGIRAAEHFKRYSAQNIEAFRLQVLADASLQYYQILLAKEDIDVAKKAVELSEYNVKYISGRQKNGMATKLDLIRAKQQLSSDQALMIQAENNEKIARINLLNTLNLDLDSNTVFSGILNYSDKKTDTNKMIEIAANNRPDLQLLYAQVDMQNENILVTKAESRPNLDLFASYTENRPESANDSSWQHGYTAGVSLTMSVFDGWRTKGKVTQELATLNQYKIDIQKKIDAIHQEIYEAVCNIQTAVSLINAYDMNRTQAKEALDLAKVGYENGVNDQLDLINAQLTFTQSLQLFAQAKYQYNSYLVALKQATGELLKPLQNTKNQQLKGSQK